MGYHTLPYFTYILTRTQKKKRKGPLSKDCRPRIEARACACARARARALFRWSLCFTYFTILYHTLLTYILTRTQKKKQNQPGPLSKDCRPRIEVRACACAR